MSDLSDDEDGQVAITTTLNSAGCDKEKMQEMDIDWPDFLEQQFKIIHAYERLGIEATLSCTPYDRGIGRIQASLGLNLMPFVFLTWTL